MPVITNGACEGMYRDAGYVEHIPNIFLCAGWAAGGRDSCEVSSSTHTRARSMSVRRWWVLPTHPSPYQIGEVDDDYAVASSYELLFVLGEHSLFYGSVCCHLINESLLFLLGGGGTRTT